VSKRRANAFRLPESPKIFEIYLTLKGQSTDALIQYKYRKALLQPNITYVNKSLDSSSTIQEKAKRRNYEYLQIGAVTLFL